MPAAPWKDTLRSNRATESSMPAYRPVLATLVYILSPDSASVLMVHRNLRQNDIHLGKYNGLGGKVEADEDVVAGLRREVREEAAITLDEVVLRGTISWPGFGKDGEPWFAFVFRADRWHGTPHAANPEGTLEWVPIAELPTKNLWPSDRLWLPFVFERSPRTFHGIMPYHNGEMVSWSYSWLP
jgi:8-oxo-dGTP diphosphatase